MNAAPPSPEADALHSDSARGDALDQAIAWKLELEDSGHLPPDRQRSFSAWLAARAANRHAWAKLEKMDAALGHIDMPARHVLGRHRRQTRLGRRTAQALLTLTLLCGGALALHAQRPLAAMTADYATATATRAAVTLPDGSQLYLDARSAVDIAFNQDERLVRLRMGTILVETASDPAQRPFIVESPYGRMQALGTRFMAEETNYGTRLTVLEHAVRASASAPERQAIVEAGQALDIQPGAIFETSRAPSDADAWMDGMLVAHDVPLASVISQLGRYRMGWLHVDAAVASLPVSGTFSLRDTDRSLLALASQLPIRIRRVSNFWVDVLPQ